MRARRHEIIFRNTAPLTIGLLCGAMPRTTARIERSRTAKPRRYCSAAEFSSRDNRHRRHGYCLGGRSRQLQLPHCKHSRCDRAGRNVGDLGLICDFVDLLLCERRWPPRAIFLEIGEHEIVLRQLPIAFAKFRGRRISGRQLAFCCPRTITLRRRYVISHRLPMDVTDLTELRACSAGRRWVKPACG